MSTTPRSEEDEITRLWHEHLKARFMGDQPLDRWAFAQGFRAGKESSQRQCLAMREVLLESCSLLRKAFKADLQTLPEITLWMERCDKVFQSVNTVLLGSPEAVHEPEGEGEPPVTDAGPVESPHEWLEQADRDEYRKAVEYSKRKSDRQS